MVNPADKQSDIVAELREALDGLLTFDLVERPAFRSMPMGAPHSTARITQDKLIALEDAARRALSRSATKET